jgi:hypothetical protein
VYADDDDYELPFRFLDQWELRDAASATIVDLPSPETSLEGWTLRGRCVPKLLRDGDDDDPKMVVQQENLGWVKLTRLDYYCVDRSRRYRGYWIVTEKAYYWLQQPQSSSHTILSRAALASLSEIIDLEENEQDANLLAKKSIHDLPIHLDLLRFVKDRVVPHLINAKPKWTERSKLIRSILQLENSQTNTMTDTHVIQICETIERNLQQTSWGKPLHLVSTSESSTTEEEKKTEDEIMMMDKETVTKTVKKSSRKPSPSNSSKKAKKETKKSVPEPVDDISDDPEESVPSEPEEKENTMINTTARVRPLRSRKRVNYAENNDQEEEDEDSSVDRARVGKSKPPAQKKQKKKKTDDDDEDASIEEVNASSSEDELLNDDESSNGEVIVQSRARPSKQYKKGVAAKAKGTNSKGKLKMFEAFQPMNAPSFKSLSLKEIQEEKEFLDPCGMEATDDIIDRLVGNQIDKISGLLKRSLESNREMGSVILPLKLGTACSGTDAPALALNIIQEQLEKRGLGDLFSFSHEFSCENEPFKQAYLARNFDSILYPDITKLTDEIPRDVYGQEKPIPPFNLFVAGTSCKNFSMLRSNKRIDIEDKGCSGETFLAATELLFQEKPQMAIFENVIRAPWVRWKKSLTLSKFEV